MVRPAVTQKFVMELLQVEVDQSSILDTQISHNGVSNFFQPQVQALQPMPLMRHQMLIYLEDFSGVKGIILMKRAQFGLSVDLTLGKIKPIPPLQISSVTKRQTRTKS